jgi:hypothetical protein
MKKKLIAFVVAGMIAAAVLPAPAFAEKVIVSDQTLDTITGAANNTSFIAGAETSTISGSNMNGSIQVGFFQWDDNHAADRSLNKGANIQSGIASQVQQNANVIANALAWGVVSQSVTINNADIAGSQTTESWAVMFVGGF